MMLKNKFAVITGSNKGIGLSILENFSKNGANIIACARSKTDEFEKRCIEISKKNNNKIFPVYFDLNKENEILDGLKNIETITQDLDILVNNAGINQASLLQMTQMKTVKEVFQVNFFSAVMLTQKLMKIMIKNRKGSIINISSNAAIECNAGRSIYSASKSAIVAFTKSLSKELGVFNIRTNAIAPGLTNTKMMSQGIQQKIIEDAIKRIPMKKVAEPDDISNVALFLASDLSSYVNGETIFVTGGY